jgi:hypothetical protein
MSGKPNKCPKCSAAALASLPFEYPSGRIHFRCDSFGYGKDIFGLTNRTELCCEREKSNKYRRAVELIAEDCEAWLNSESDEPSCDFIKLVAKYAREALQ